MFSNDERRSCPQAAHGMSRAWTIMLVALTLVAFDELLVLLELLEEAIPSER
jgi:hypothetical protein